MRRILEFLTPMSFIVTLISVPNAEWRWFFGGATASGIIVLVVMEWLVVQTENVSQTKHMQIEELQRRFNELAVFNDPAMLAIFSEDQKERLRIEREAMQRVNKSAESASKAQQHYADRLRNQFLERNQVLDDMMREFIRNEAEDKKQPGA